jgi:NADPH:quinone reductase-like Zn-dependent oxidoreductase
VRLQALLVGSRRQQQDFVRAIEATGMRPVIDRHFQLDDLVAAFQYQASGQHFGKIVIDI